LISRPAPKPHTRDLSSRSLASTPYTTLPLRELRELITLAHSFVAGHAHYSFMCYPLEQGLFWSKVYGVHPAIKALLCDWHLWIDQTWNEWGRYPQSLPEDELRRRIARDLDDTQIDPVMLRSFQQLKPSRGVE
jgi:hypothetical protein